MAGTITYDTDGGNFLAGIDGNTWAREFWISGLTSGVSVSAPNIPNLISEAFVLVPDTGTAAPSPILNMFVRSAGFDRFWCEDEATPTWGASGVINYATPTRAGGAFVGSVPDSNGPGITLATSSAVQEIDLYYDVLGAQLTTTNDNVTQAHRAVGFAVVASHTFTRLEDAHPEGRINTYTGKLNSALWNGYAAKSMLCANIDVRSDDGENWVVTYTFEYKPPAQWQATFIHDDPFYPGNPIPLSEADPGALLVADVLDTVDFGPLNIVFPS